LRHAFCASRRKKPSLARVEVAAACCLAAAYGRELVGASMGIGRALEVILIANYVSGDLQSASYVNRSLPDADLDRFCRCAWPPVSPPSTNRQSCRPSASHIASLPPESKSNPGGMPWRCFEGLPATSREAKRAVIERPFANLATNNRLGRFCLSEDKAEDSMNAQPPMAHSAK